ERPAAPQPATTSLLAAITRTDPSSRHSTTVPEIIARAAHDGSVVAVADRQPVHVTLERPLALVPPRLDVAACLFLGDARQRDLARHARLAGGVRAVDGRLDLALPGVGHPATPSELAPRPVLARRAAVRTEVAGGAAPRRGSSTSGTPRSSARLQSGRRLRENVTPWSRRPSYATRECRRRAPGGLEARLGTACTYRR